MVLLRSPVKEVDGISLFSPDIKENHCDYHTTGLDKLYEAEEKHFWFLARKEQILNLFQQYIPISAAILEIGAGTGNVSRALLKAGYEISIAEIHLKGLQYALQYGVKNGYQFDLFDPPFAEHFDVIGMFDVLEHLDDDVEALRRVRDILRNRGRLILTVPAHNWLWCRDDRVAGHKRRYTKITLRRAAKAAGFRIVEVRYFFIFILPLLWLRHIVNKDNGEMVQETEREQEIQINPLVNKVLMGVSLLENKLCRFLPNIMGGSLILVAEKDDI